MAHPAHRSRKKTHEGPGATIGLRAAQVIEQQRTEMRSNLGAALDGRDPDGVHDMRVASRRLRACLQLFAPWIEEDDRDRTAAAVRSVTRALGRVRELDVLRLRLADLGQKARPERALALEAIDARLEQRRRKVRSKMMTRFAKVDLDRFDHRLRRLVAHLETSGRPEAAGMTEPPDSAESGVAIRAETASATSRNRAPAVEPPSAPSAALVRVAAPEIRTAVRDALEHEIPPEVGSAEAAEALHQVRIAAKKLRYLLEVVAPYLGDHGPAIVKRLKSLQDGLGDFHDDVVLDDVLVQAIADANERERKLLAREIRRFRALRRRALARDERAVRDAIVALRDGGFARAIEDALVAAGVEVPEPPVESIDFDDGDDADEGGADAGPGSRKRPPTLH